MTSSPTSAPPPSSSVASGDPLRAELEHTKRVLASKLVELRQFQTERETLLARISDREARVRELEGAGSNDAERVERRITELERELASAREAADRVPMLDAALSAMRATFRRLEKELGERDAKISALETELGERDAAVAPLERELGARSERLALFERDLAARDAKISALEQELSESLAWSAPPEDDLKRIRGVGPKFERILHELGVHTFAQIATWTDADVARVAERLKIQPARIAREAWSDSARALMKR